MIGDNVGPIMVGTVVGVRKDGKLYERPADGKFYVRVKELKTTFTVTYTTPFYKYGRGGMLAIPDPGSKVLIYAAPNNEYYYLSTIVEKANKKSSKQPKDLFDQVKKVYPDGSPLGHQVTFTNQEGAGLKINNIAKGASIPGDPPKIIKNVILKSFKGKEVILNDTPKNDSIQIMNEHKDGIVINSDGNSVSARRSINISAQNSVNCISHQSSVKIAVGNGGHIDIINYSSDIFNLNVLNPMFDGGNVNIISQNRDVNIAVRGVTSNVFITTRLARIRIDELGGVTIQAPNIYFKGLNSINLDAPIVNINSTLGTNMYSTGTTNITSLLTTEVEGTGGVYLNSNNPGTPKPILLNATITDNLD